MAANMGPVTEQIARAMLESLRTHGGLIEHGQWEWLTVRVQRNGRRVTVGFTSGTGQREVAG